MQTRSLLFLVTLFLLAGCQDDLKEQKAAWDTTTRGWAAHVEKLKQDQAALTEKVKSLASSEQDAAVATERQAVDNAVKAVAAGIAEAETVIAKGKTTIDDLIARGKKLPLEIALNPTRNAVDGVLTRADSLINSASGAIDTFNRKAQAAKVAAEAARSRVQAWSGELKKKGGMISVDDLEFDQAQLAVDKSRIALDSLVATLKSCPELRTDLSAGAPTAELGSARAEALKAWLTTNGVDPAVIAKTSGAAATDGDEKVTVTITTPCK